MTPDEERSRRDHPTGLYDPEFPTLKLLSSDIPCAVCGGVHGITFCPVLAGEGDDEDE